MNSLISPRDREVGHSPWHTLVLFLLLSLDLRRLAVAETVLHSYSIFHSPAHTANCTKPILPWPVFPTQRSRRSVSVSYSADGPSNFPIPIKFCLHLLSCEIRLRWNRTLHQATSTLPCFTVTSLNTYSWLPYPELRINLSMACRMIKKIVILVFRCQHFRLRQQNETQSLTALGRETETKKAKLRDLRQGGGAASIKPKPRILSTYWSLRGRSDDDPQFGN